MPVADADAKMINKNKCAAAPPGLFGQRSAVVGCSQLIVSHSLYNDDDNTKDVVSHRFENSPKLIGDRRPPRPFRRGELLNDIFTWCYENS